LSKSNCNKTFNIFYPLEAKAMKLSRNWMWIFLLFFLMTLPTACLSSKKLTVGATASLLEEVYQASSKQSDLKIIHAGMPAYLMLLDGMVEALPHNERLLISAAQSYSSYASAFIEDEDKDYASILYGKATEYAIRALQARGFERPREQSFDQFEESLKSRNKKDVSYLFWTATCWGNWISLNLGSMEAMAELPRVELMMRRVLELDEEFYYGGPHIFMGIWYSSRPKMAGGNLNLARNHFLKALELGQGKFLMTNIYYAKYYARKSFDKDLFISVLEKVLETPVDIAPDVTLFNSVAHQKAKDMLEHVDEYF
jgi:hypothetical protein